MVTSNTQASFALRELLSKLGIKSARFGILESMLWVAQNDFGRPDELIMDSKSLEAYKKILDRG